MAHGPHRCGGALFLVLIYFTLLGVCGPHNQGEHQLRTGMRLRCSVVGLLRAPLAPRLSGSRGSAPCAFPALSPTRFGLLVGCHKAAYQRRLWGLASPWREGDSRPSLGGLFIKAGDCFCSRPAASIIFQPGSPCEITWSSVVIPVSPALVMAADDLELPSVSSKSPHHPFALIHNLFTLLRH
jgi:hypothetical protein